MAQGFQLFKKDYIRKHLLDIWTDRKRQNISAFPPALDKIYAYFIHRKTAMTNQNIFRTLKHVFEREYTVPQNFTHSEFDSVPESEFFPPHLCAHGPGKDPFEAVMCPVEAASQISCMRTEDA